MNITHSFLRENMMGPNAWALAEELTCNLPIKKECEFWIWDAAEDRLMLEADRGRFMNLIKFTGTIR